MIEKVKITKATIQDGVAKTTQKPYSKIGIQTDKYGDKWLGCFLSEFNKSSLLKIKEGDTVEIVVEKSGDFLNFKLPSQHDRLEARVIVLESQMGGTSTGHQDNTEVEDINPDDIPF